MGTGLQRADMLVPGGNLEAYIQTVNGIPVLTVEEERALADKLYHDGDLEAARRLVLSHLRFVVHIAKSYAGYGLAQADLIQEGNVGLMKAVKRFNPEYGVRLVSFAVHWIKAEIHEFILRNWRIVKIATTKAQRKMFFNLRSSKKRLGWFTHDEVESVAEVLGVDAAVVREMEGRLSSQDTSFEASVDDDDTAYLAPENYIEDHSYDPARNLEAHDWSEDQSTRLQQALQTLDARSLDILNKRWLTDDKATLHDLAAEYGVSAERIRQLEKNAMNKVKALMVA